MSSVSVKTPFKAVKIALPESSLPILIPCRQQIRSGVWQGHDGSGVVSAPVKQLSQRELEEYMDLGTRQDFEKTYGKGGEPDALRLFIDMARAIKRGRLEHAESLLNDFSRKWIGEALPMPRPTVVQTLSWFFTSRISKAAPIVWHPDNSGRLAFGLHCDDVATALFLLALQRVGVAVIGQCQGCGSALIADRTSKKFCNAKCRAKSFQRKKRARTKSPEKRTAQ